MLCMIVSCVMFAYIVGSIGTLVRAASEVSDKLRDQMLSVNNLLSFRKIPIEMRTKIKRYLQYVIEERSQVAIDEDSLLKQLSTPLRDELIVYFRGRYLQNCPIFDDFSIDFMSYLTFFLQIESFSAGDTVFEVGSCGYPRVGR